jgi:hypothetical protein
MIYSTATVPVNPEGETKLARAQARPISCPEPRSGKSLLMFSKRTRSKP